MRVLLVVLALVATPFLVGAAQSQQGSNCNNGQGDENRSAQGTANAHRGQCVSQGGGGGGSGGGGSSTCAVSQLSGGTGTVDGWVFDARSGAFLSGWCVELSGTTATGDAVHAAMLSDGTGYRFTNVPAGEYTICEVPQSGWTQTFPSQGPSCLNGTIGWLIPLFVTLFDGWGASWNAFGNSQ